MRTFLKVLLYLMIGMSIGVVTSLFWTGNMHVKIDGIPSEEDVAIDEDVQRGVAMHEAGHAIVSAYLCGPDSVKRVVTNSTLDNGGYGATYMKSVNKLDTADDMMRDVAIYMGGRAGDVVINGAATNGAGSDLRNANDIVWNMHLASGLGGSLLVQSKAYADSELTAKVKKELDEANACAEAIVTKNRDVVVLIGEEAMRQPIVAGERTLSGDAVRRIIKANGLTIPGPSVQAKLPTYCRQYIKK